MLFIFDFSTKQVVYGVHEEAVVFKKAQDKQIDDNCKNQCAFSGFVMNLFTPDIDCHKSSRS